MNGESKTEKLVLAYLAAVGNGATDLAGVERQINEAAAFLARHGAAEATVDVLRVMAALCETAVRLREEAAG